MGHGRVCPKTSDERVVEVFQDHGHQIGPGKLKRVGAYCRVSTDSDEQQESLENQINAFNHQMMIRDDWKLEKIYVDEGITGTSVKKRTGFQQMIRDCMDGHIDCIITKSISRFARNTADCITYVRKLQAMGVQVYFEKEGIDTSDSYSEMLLTVMAAFAQEESRSISENVKWSMRKRFSAGEEIPVPIYGYRHTKEELYQIIPEEADIVREIYSRFVHGEMYGEIMRDMIRRGVQPPAGKTWNIPQLRRMLRNEKYVGDVTLQKNYIVDHLTHREVRNHGEVPMVHIRNAHPAIIDRHLFDQAQVIFSMRNVSQGNSTYPYRTMLKCPLCGEMLLHGSLNAMYFGGKKMRHGGGWGCYGEKGCRRFLLIQQFLDQAVLDAYESRYGMKKEQVDYYWLDDLVKRIRLTRNRVTVFWKEGGKTEGVYAFTHEEQQPIHAAQRYNEYLKKADQHRRQYKHMMGLQTVRTNS